ncbi:hypothetical protein Scep_003467 [Stephania cephalantha]|uniref:CobQ/CobB/MinD/ParA nucleotide binding domain-containing protein n=1 Tax=Stephania cephalantha TaxID=152367 RepID=A0AAP0PUG7_9MAGN
MEMKDGHMKRTGTYATTEVDRVVTDSPTTLDMGGISVVLQWNRKPQLSGDTPRVVVITSGKGKVGKTTTTANVGLSLARLGFSVVAIDADVGLRNLDLLLGLENRINHTVVEVLNGDCRLDQALVRDKRWSTAAAVVAATMEIEPIPRLLLNQFESCEDEERKEERTERTERSETRDDRERRKRRDRRQRQSQSGMN